MLKYIFRRILLLIPVLIGITLFIYLVLSLSPGDPAELLSDQTATREQIEQLRVELGLDKPVLVQYVRYMWNAVRGDFGTSWFMKKSVVEELKHRMPYSLKLGTFAILISSLVGIPLGTLAAVKHNGPLDYGLTVLSLLLSSAPGFWLGMMAQVLFSMNLKWLPAFGVGSWKNYILPVFSICAASIAANSRSTRTWVLDVIRSDYVRTARAKGAKEVTVIMKHALRNALLPVITGLGMQFAGLMGGTVVVESVFSFPGIGSYLTNGVKVRDVPVVMGVILVIAIFVGVVNMLVDLTYAVIDPRVKVGS